MNCWASLALQKLKKKKEQKFAKKKKPLYRVCVCRLLERKWMEERNEEVEKETLTLELAPLGESEGFVI